MRFASGWALGQQEGQGAGRAPLTERGTEPRARAGAVVREREGQGRSPWQPSGPSSPRNFRKHLRMVGSRRVKAQSKGTGKGGSGEGKGWWGGRLLFALGWALNERTNAARCGEDP